MTAFGEGTSSARARWAAAGAFTVLFLFQAYSLTARLKKDARPLPWDEAVHMRAAWKYRRDLAAGRLGGVLHPPHTPGHPPYPPLTHLFMAATSRLSGPLGVTVEAGAVLANLLFLMLLAWGAYLLAADWWGEAAGVAAAFLTSLSPPLMMASRYLVVDVALTAWVVLAYAAWSRSRRFSLWTGSAALGLAGAAGMLTKWSFFLYVLPILAAGGWELLRPSGPRARARVLTAFLIAAFLAAPWYGVNLVNVFVKTARSAGLGAQEGDPTGGLAAWLYYVGSFKDGVGWPGLVAALAGFVWLAFWRPQNGWTLASWLASSYALWSLVSNKDPRVHVSGPGRLVHRRFLPAFPPAFGPGLPLGGERFLVRPFHLGGALLSVLAFEGDGRAGRGSPPGAVGTSGGPHAPGQPRFPRRQQPPLDRGAGRVGRGPPGPEPLFGPGRVTEFVLIKTGDLGPARTVAGHERMRDEALRPDGWFQRNFSKRAEWPLPDGSQALLFQRLPVSSAPAVQMDPVGALSRLAPGGAAEGLRGDCGGGPMIEGEGDCAVEASKLRFDGLILRDVKARLDGLWITADDDGRPRLLGLKKVEALSLRLTETDAALFLSSRFKFLKKASVRFLPGNELEASGLLGFLPVRVRVKLAYDAAADSLRAEVRSARLLGVPLPTRRTVEASLAPKRGLPFLVKLSGLRTVPAARGAEGSLEVSP